MATKEQIRRRLNKRIKTRQQALDFARRFAVDREGNPSIPTGEFITQAIESVLSNAENLDLLDDLGQKYSFPSDAEAGRLARRSVSRRSWMAIGISVIALLVSAAVAV